MNAPADAAELLAEGEARMQLRLEAQGTQATFAHFRIYNGRMELMQKGYHPVVAQLPPDVYVVELAVNDYVEQRTVRLDGDRAEVFQLPQPCSAVVAQGFETSHEYYTGPAQHFSRELTAPTPGSLKAVGSLFLFFRYADADSSEALNTGKATLGKGFTLLDEKRQKLFSLSGKAIREDRQQGWLAFHAALPAGSYYLHYKGQRGDAAREIPLLIAPGDGAAYPQGNRWQTQVFLLFGRKAADAAAVQPGPQFQTLRISLAPAQVGFQEDDRHYPLLDGMMQKLQNGIFYIPDEQLQALASDNWYSPMDGLLAGYVYFSGDKRNAENLFRGIGATVGALLGKNTPDGAALQLLSANWYDTAPPTALRVADPPLFLAGTKALIKAAATMPKLVVPGSLLEQIAGRLYEDLIWTSYDPPPIYEAPKANTISGSASPPVTGFSISRAAPPAANLSASAKSAAARKENLFGKANLKNAFLPPGRGQEGPPFSARGSQLPAGKGRVTSTAFVKPSAAVLNALKARAQQTAKASKKPPATSTSLEALQSSAIAEDLLAYAARMEQLTQKSTAPADGSPQLTVQDAAQRLRLTPNTIIETAKAVIAQEKAIAAARPRKGKKALPEVFNTENIAALKTLLRNK